LPILADMMRISKKYENSLLLDYAEKYPSENPMKDTHGIEDFIT
jgi:hypothetical protein